MPRRVRVATQAIGFAVVLAAVAVFNREGAGVPTNNEWVYLPLMERAWDPEVLASDWTFSAPYPLHRVFNLTFGWLTLFLAPVAVAWIGRGICWLLALGGLWSLGRCHRIPAWTIAFALLLWLLAGQSLVGGSWMLGTFEAKCMAYGCLLFAITGFVRGRRLLPSALLGLSFSFHPHVGLWGSLACGAALLTLRPRLRTLATCAAVVFVAAVPGIVDSLAFVRGGTGASPGAVEFLVTQAFPFHLDPLTFARPKLALLGIMFMFVVLNSWRNRDDPAARFCLVFLACTGIVFGLGFVARRLGAYSLLTSFPFRLFPLFVPLLFFFHLMQACAGPHGRRVHPALVVAGVLALVCLDNPLPEMRERIGSRYRAWARGPNDLQQALAWVAGNTPGDIVLIASPGRKEAWHYGRRALVASWGLPRYDKLEEWRERLAALVGDLSAPGIAYMAQGRYRELGEAEIETIRSRYGGDVMITTADYGYPVLYEAGREKVYALSARAMPVCDETAVREE